MTHLKEGDQAPAFEGIDQNENKVSLEQYKGKKLVLYFYPKDNTPGCTAEACNLRDHHQELLDKGFAVVGVSPDSLRKHQNFAKKHELPFPLIADTEKEVIEAYGIWGPKKFMGREYEGVHRTTFVIGEDGTIEKIYKKVKTKAHAEQIFADYAA